MPMLRFLAAVLSILALFPIARAEAQDNAAPDLCALVSNADLQAILHQAVQGPQRDSIGTCTWRIAGMNAVTIQPNETGQAGLNNARSRTANTIALSGIGDDAFAFVSQAGFAQVSFVKHGRFVVVIYQGGSNATRLDAAKAIAAKVASGL
jgi:hypothetical protein